MIPLMLLFKCTREGENVCAKKEKLIQDCKDKIQETHSSTIAKLDEVLLLMQPQPVKVKGNAVSR